MTENNPKPAPVSNPGDGIKSMTATNLFRVVNFELYAKPNKVIMAIGLVCFTSSLAYLAYMKSKYEGMGYQAAIEPDGQEVFKKKKSKWD